LQPVSSSFATPPPAVSWLLSSAQAVQFVLPSSRARPSLRGKVTGIDRLVVSHSYFCNFSRPAPHQRACLPSVVIISLPPLSPQQHHLEISLSSSQPAPALGSTLPWPASSLPGLDWPSGSAAHHLHLCLAHLEDVAWPAETVLSAVASGHTSPCRCCILSGRLSVLACHLGTRLGI
jgi:hypothetical protein